MEAFFILAAWCTLRTSDLELMRAIQDSNGHSYQVARWLVTDIIPQLCLYSPKGKPLHGDLIMDSPKKLYTYNIIISGQISSIEYAPPHHLMLL